MRDGAVVGVTKVLVEFNHPLLVLLLLNGSYLLQLTGPLVLQHLKHQTQQLLTTLRESVS